MEEVKDKLMGTHMDVGTEMTIDKDKPTSFEESLGIKDLLVEDQDVLTKVLMFPDPV